MIIMIAIHPIDSNIILPAIVDLKSISMLQKRFEVLSKVANLV